LCLIFYLFLCECDGLFQLRSSSQTNPWSLSLCITYTPGPTIYTEAVRTTLSPFKTTTGATSGTGTAYPYGAPEFTAGFSGGSCYSIFSFICMFCRSLFVLLYFSFGHCVVCSSSIYGFDLITPLVSACSSCITHVLKTSLQIRTQINTRLQQSC